MKKPWKTIYDKITETENIFFSWMVTPGFVNGGTYGHRDCMCLYSLVGD